MNLKLWIDISKAVIDLHGHLDTLDKHAKAAERASNGREPYPSRASVEAALRRVEDITRRMDELGRSGIGMHQPAPIGMAELANPATRARSLLTFRTELAQREQFLSECQQVLGEAERLSREAPQRTAGLREVQKFFERMVTTRAPVDLGSVGRASAFEYYRLFERATGRMSSLGNAATRAATRVRPEVSRLQQETNNLRSNLRTFGLL